jgi:hypothetical protein
MIDNKVVIHLIYAKLSLSFRIKNVNTVYEIINTIIFLVI